MKRIGAGLVSLLAIALAAWYGGRQAPSSRGGVETPLACVERMFWAAARGDVPEYVACFAGAQRQLLERSLVQESGLSAGSSLRQTVAELKGWAVLDPPANDSSESWCRLTVERVYAGRIDRQRMELRRERSGWQIHLVEPVEPKQPAIAYGTPIYVVGPPASDDGKGSQGETAPEPK